MALLTSISMGIQFLFLSIIVDIFDIVADIIDAVIGIFQTIFADTGVIAIFYDSVTGLTFIGALLLIVFGFGLVTWAFNWVKRLLQMRR